MKQNINSPATSAVREFFGTVLSPVSFEVWLSGISRVISSGRRHHLSGHHNLHSLYLKNADSNVAEFYHRCDDCYIDGKAVLLLLRKGPFPAAGRNRFSLMDTFTCFLEHAQRNSWTVYYLGSSEDVVQKARERIAAEYPGLNIHLHHGYLREDSVIADTINEIKPDILLVGMGMPRQEAWLLRYIDTLDVAVATQAGATLDYFVGAQAKPPVWLSNLGSAWLYRLVHDPARLWRRYLVEPWVLIKPTIRYWLAS
jgi:N-acetylglucosaminyldiphosphoundecaprenol N-acetyl-beta-D-mannosaminyltransferase